MFSRSVARRPRGATEMAFFKACGLEDRTPDPGLVMRVGGIPLSYTPRTLQYDHYIALYMIISMIILPKVHGLDPCIAFFKYYRSQVLIPC